MAQRNLKITELLLDQLNPRNEPAASQRDALQQIIDDQDVKLAVLAEHIVENGLNPMDRLLVVKAEDSSDYVVLEGNRRTAALKVLSNPAVLTGLDVRPALQKRLEAAASNFDRKEVEPVACFEVTDREAGNRWIEQRHTGENGGSGIVNWQGVQRARFVGTDPALQALDFVKQHGNLTAAQLQAIDEGRFISTLERLLSTPDVRKTIGVSLKDGRLISGLPGHEVIKPLRRMVLDLAEKRVNVTQLKKKDQQVAYVEGFEKSDKPDLATKGQERPVIDLKATDFAKPVKRAATKRRIDPSDRKTVVPKGFSLPIADNRIAQIFRELRTLKLDEAPNAIAVLTRVFLELSVEHYLRTNSLPLTIPVPGQGDKDKSLKAKMDDAVTHMKANGVPGKDLQPVVRALSVKHSPLHIDLLHAYVHNRHAAPSPAELRAGWDVAQPFFERIWA
jgi:hypothetical protein